MTAPETNAERARALVNAAISRMHTVPTGAQMDRFYETALAALDAAERRGMERAAEIAEKEAAIGVPFTIEGASYSATCRIVADAIRAAAKEGA